MQFVSLKTALASLIFKSKENIGQSVFSVVTGKQFTSLSFSESFLLMKFLFEHNYTCVVFLWHQ